MVTYGVQTKSVEVYIHIFVGHMPMTFEDWKIENSDEYGLDVDLECPSDVAERFARKVWDAATAAERMTDMLEELPMTDIIHNLCERIKRLEAYVEEDACCPCCEELEQCDDECTFEYDCIENNCYDRCERMIAAREVLYGNNE